MTKQEQLDSFTQIVETIRATLLSKGDDYAQEDRLSNFKFAGQIIGLTPEKQCLSLIAVKVARLGTLLSKESEPNNESIEDSVLDLICYSILLKMLLEDRDNLNKINY